MRNTERLNELCDRLAKAVLNNYDEYIGELETPAYVLDLTQGNFEIPNNAPELPNDCFVDELYAYEDELNDGIVSLCFSTESDDYIERVDEMDVYELNIEYLERLVEYAENHNGTKAK